MQVYLRHVPTVAPLPLVLDSPHSGTSYPADFDHLPSRAIVRRAEDTHVETLFGGAPDAGATLVEALFPRAYIDPNRHPSDMDPAVLEAEVRKVVVAECGKLGVRAEFRTAQSLRPGRPVPTHRYAQAK